jgi:molybdenum cofactor cytidylyltransferase
MEACRGLDCILLAAGESSRMGKPKLLLPFRGTTVIGALVEAVLGAGLRPIIVSRPGDGTLAAALSGFRGIRFAVNPEPGRGMLSSFQAGAREVGSDRFFFMPADMPFVTAPVFERLALVAAAGPVIPRCGERKGHPVLMPSSLIPAILALPANIPLKALILASGPTYADFAEEAILRDIDTGSDYAEALASASLAEVPHAQLPL